MSHFDPERWLEFLEGGHVRKTHTEDIPIWAGFLVAQIADLRAQIGVLLMTQAVSLHQMFQGDMGAIQAAFNQLVSANTTAKAYSQQLLAQIATLQAQVADPNGDPVTSDDLTQMNSLAAQIQQAAAATVTTSTTTPANTGAAGSDTSGTASATDTTGTTAASTGDTAAAPSDGSAAAATGNDSTATAPTTDAPAAAAPSTDTTSVPDTTAAADPSQPVAIDASDSGAGSNE